MLDIATSGIGRVASTLANVPKAVDAAASWAATATAHDARQLMGREASIGLGRVRVFKATEKKPEARIKSLGWRKTGVKSRLHIEDGGVEDLSGEFVIVPGKKISATSRAAKMALTFGFGAQMKRGAREGGSGGEATGIWLREGKARLPIRRIYKLMSPKEAENLQTVGTLRAEKAYAGHFAAEIGIQMAKG